MEIKSLDSKIINDLGRCLSFTKVLDNGKDIIFLHAPSTHSIHFTKNQNELYDARFSSYVPEFKTLFEPYKK